jgi:choline dehydrogenase-like flavoprotein
MGFYSSLGAVNRTDDPGKRSYAATGYLKPNLHRPNLKVLVEAQATKILGIEDKQASGVEFVHGGKTYSVSATREVVLSTGVIQTPQLLELSGIGDPEVLKNAGIECKIENISVGENFQDHVLGGLLFDLKPGVASLDDLHGADFAKASQDLYDKTHQGPFGSPGMMMGFVSYASLVGKETLDKTLQEIKDNSLAKTKFAKAQEKVITDQLTDPTFANLQTFCIMCRLDVGEGSDQTKFFSKPPEVSTRYVISWIMLTLCRAPLRFRSLCVSSTPYLEVQCTSPLRIP